MTSSEKVCTSTIDREIAQSSLLSENAFKRLLTLSEDGSIAQSGLHIAFLWGLTVSDRYVLTNSYTSLVNDSCARNPESLLNPNYFKFFEGYFRSHPKIMVLPIRPRKSKYSQDDKDIPYHLSSDGGSPNPADAKDKGDEWVSVLTFIDPSNVNVGVMLFAWGDIKSGFISTRAVHLDLIKLKEHLDISGVQIAAYGDVTNFICGAIKITHDKAFDIYGSDGVPGAEQEAIMLTELPFFLGAVLGMYSKNTRKIRSGVNEKVRTPEPSIAQECEGKDIFLFPPLSAIQSSSPSFAYERRFFKPGLVWR